MFACVSGCRMRNCTRSGPSNRWLAGCHNTAAASDQAIDSRRECWPVTHTSRCWSPRNVQPRPVRSQQSAVICTPNQQLTPARFQVQAPRSGLSGNLIRERHTASTIVMTVRQFDLDRGAVPAIEQKSPADLPTPQSRPRLPCRRFQPLVGCRTCSPGDTARRKPLFYQS